MNNDELKSKLLDATVKALRERPSTVSFDDIAAATGLTFAWISKLHRGRVQHPSVCRVERLYTFLTGRDLIV